MPLADVGLAAALANYRIRGGGWRPKSASRNNTLKRQTECLFFFLFWDSQNILGGFRIQLMISLGNYR